MGYQAGELIGKELAEAPVNEKKADLLETVNSCIRIGKVSEPAVPSFTFPWPEGKEGDLVLAELHPRRVVSVSLVPEALGNVGGSAPSLPFCRGGHWDQENTS